MPDPRVDRTNEHDLVDILMIALCTILCGGESFYDMEEFAQVRLVWLQTFLRLRNGAPSHDTFNRVFQALDARVLADTLSRWTQSVRRVLGGEVVALDGKRVRRALNQGEDFRVIVSAWATESGLLLGQRSVERRYYLSSLPLEVNRFAQAVRGHWNIENQLHWVLDVVFGEDQARARTEQAAENLAAMRRMAVNLLRQDKQCRRSIKGKLMRAAIDPDYLKHLLTI
jgi:predicted transposase YbfD/YdcC